MPHSKAAVMACRLGRIAPVSLGCRLSACPGSAGGAEVLLTDLKTTAVLSRQLHALQRQAIDPCWGRPAHPLAHLTTHAPSSFQAWPNV